MDNVSTQGIAEQVMARVNSQTVEEKTPNGELGQTDFLELMIAQIKHQDPFEPMDNGQFIAQMAQFATVDGIQNMENSISELNGTMTSNQTLTATSLVGRNVMAPGGDVILDTEGSIGGVINADPTASQLTMNVMDSNGALVARYQLTPSSSGTTRFRFDGFDSGGARLAPGNYRIEAQALVAGKPDGAQVSTSSRIESVTIGHALDDLKLNLDSGIAVPFSSVSEFL